MRSNPCILATAALWACSGGGTADLEVQTGSLVFAEESGTGCVTPMSLRGGLPAGVDRMVVQVVSESDGQVAVTRVVTPEDLAGRREVIVTGVPEGTYRLVVTGCGGDASALWGGRSAAFSVAPGSKSAPIVYVARSGALNCVGGKNQNPLQPKFDGDGFYVAGRAAFQAAMVTPGGRVFVTGGFASDEFQVTGDVLKAGRRVWEFHPETGVFTGVFSPSGERLELAEPRAAHGMAALGAGGMEWLVLAGGMSSAVLGPEKYPVQEAPLDRASPVRSPVEVVAIPAAGGAEGPSARALPVAYDAAFPSWAFSGDGRTVALVGGKESGSVSGAVTVVTLDEAALAGTAGPSVRTGSLARKRFGASAVFLSTGEVVVVGGTDGTGPAGVEMVRPSGAGALESVALAADLPAGVAPTAFASVGVLRDDRTRASLLVLGGNPVGGATAFADATAANAFLVELDGDGQTYDPASARTRPVSGVGEWAGRSLAGLVRVGDRWLLVGGLRSFNAEAGVAGCGTGGPVWGAYCFPRTLQAFDADADAATVTGLGGWEDLKSRLGVAVVALPHGGVMLLGGVNGSGTRPVPLPADFDPLLSTGLVWFPEDAFDPAACQASSAP